MATSTLVTLLVFAIALSAKGNDFGGSTGQSSIHQLAWGYSMPTHFLITSTFDPTTPRDGWGVRAAHCLRPFVAFCSMDFLGGGNV